MLENEDWNQNNGDGNVSGSQENSIYQEEEYRSMEEWNKERDKYRRLIEAEYKQGKLVGSMVGMTVAFVLVLVVFLGYNYLHYQNKTGNAVKPTENASNLTDESIMQKVEGLQSLINSEFLYEADIDQLAEGMYAGLLAGLDDKYSVYYTKEEYNQLMEGESGEYEGIGVAVALDSKDNNIYIVSVYEGSPAAKAGLKSGDILEKVNGNSVKNKKLDDVVVEIRKGESKTSKLSIIRDKKSMDIEVTRETVTIPSVAKTMLNNNIGYIGISQFAMNTSEQFTKAYKELEAQGMKGLIIDIRNNPGGLLTTVCDMLDSMLPEGLIMYEIDKAGNRQEQLSDGDYMLKVPLAVIVNENSASASEVFSGVVQDYKIGTIVGTTTFGKGVVQNIYPLNDGSAVKLTVEKYYTAKGQDINGRGIIPDVVCEVPKKLKDQLTFAYKDDVQLHKAEEIVKDKIEK